MNKNTTTTTKETKRQKKATESNTKRLATTKANIEKATQESETLVNAKAIETMQALKQYGKESRQFNNVAQQLCTILVQSKLKRLYNNGKTSSEQQRTLKAKISAYMDKNGNGNKIQTALDELEKLYITRYNQNGEKEIMCTDKKQAQEIEKKIIEYSSIGNNGGHDLVQDALLKLWSYIKKIEDISTVPENYLLQPFEIPLLHLNYYRKSGQPKPKNLWQYANTNVIKEISKTITQIIDDEKAIKDTFEPFEEKTVELDGIALRTYHKTRAIYCDTVTDFNGKVTTVVNNQTTEQLFESIPEKCNLSKMESVVLKLHYYGDSNGKSLSFEQIADKYEVSVESIKKHDARLKDKIVKSGVFAKYGFTERVNNGQTATAVYMFTIDGDFIQEFESLGVASKALKIDKGSLSKVLNGRRKSVNGCIFKYTR